MQITKKRRHIFSENTPNFIFGEIKVRKLINNNDYWIDSSRLTIDFHYVLKHQKVFVAYDFEHHVEDERGLHWKCMDKSEEQITLSNDLFQYAYALANDEVTGTTEEYMFDKFVSRYLRMKCQK